MNTIHSKAYIHSILAGLFNDHLSFSHQARKPYFTDPSWCSNINTHNLKHTVFGLLQNTLPFAGSIAAIRGSDMQDKSARWLSFLAAKELTGLVIDPKNHDPLAIYKKAAISARFCMQKNINPSWPVSARLAAESFVAISTSFSDLDNNAVKPKRAFCEFWVAENQKTLFAEWGFSKSDQQAFVSKIMTDPCQASVPASLHTSMDSQFLAEQAILFFASNLLNLTHQDNKKRRHVQLEVAREKSFAHWQEDILSFCSPQQEYEPVMNA